MEFFLSHSGISRISDALLFRDLSQRETRDKHSGNDAVAEIMFRASLEVNRSSGGLADCTEEVRTRLQAKADALVITDFS